MSARRQAIRAIYAQLNAPDWAAANLDALADVLRDLSWLPEGSVSLAWVPPGDLGEPDRVAVEAVLRHAAAETADGPRPIRLV